MTRPVTLFTGQWADLTLEELAEKCGVWGFDGLELACWGDHFDVAEALSDSGYRHVIATLWDVDSEVAALVTHGVYKRLMSGASVRPKNCEALFEPGVGVAK